MIAPLILIGMVGYYAPHYSMVDIARNQGVYLPPDHIGVATWDRQYLGWHGRLEVGGQSWECVVVDYTAERDLEYVRGRDIVAEVDWDTASRAGFVYDGLAEGRLTLYPPDGGGRWVQE